MVGSSGWRYIVHAHSTLPFWLSFICGAFISHTSYRKKDSYREEYTDTLHFIHLIHCNYSTVTLTVTVTVTLTATVDS